MSICTRCPLLAVKWSSRCVGSAGTDFRTKFVTLPFTHTYSTLYTNSDPRECRTMNDDIFTVKCTKLHDASPYPTRIKMQALPGKREENLKTSMPYLALPADMSSRVMQLYPMEIGLTRDCDPLLFAPIKILLNDSSTSHSLEELVTELLWACETKQWSQNSQEKNLHFTSEKKTEKDIEPADDPKQKMRNLEMKLRKQLPRFLNSGSAWHDFSIYTPNIELDIMPRRYGRRHSFRGLPLYKRIAKCFRFACKFCLNDPRLEVLSLTSHENKKIFEVRWRVVGVPYYLLLLSYLPPLSRQRFVRNYDYMSTLSMTDDAEVWHHNIDKLRPARSQLLRNFVSIKKNIRGAAAITPIVPKEST